MKTRTTRRVSSAQSPAPPASRSAGLPRGGWGIPSGVDWSVTIHPMMEGVVGKCVGKKARGRDAWSGCRCSAPKGHTLDVLQRDGDLVSM